ncbi:hypothetical protein [Nesterenkonia pannonica]|uniref:hypothetical protein n=1 Tax=Nesterenkonia pannonica TaxID=1548602 RepID=UPI0021648CF4|nr:hypothetical protein [Nesterenkonia pannonica]
MSLTADELRETDLDQGAALLPELLSLQTDSSEAARGSDELTDPLVLDLVDRIRARGGRVEDAFRGTMDLAACPRKISLTAQVTPVAMISDGTAAYAAQSVRERSRLIPQRFRSLGWECMVLWTIEVFSDPRRITELVAEKVGLSSGPEFAEGGRARLPRLRASA